jgi:cyclophilin family peptidyl-prolyl cis-trans isomerase
MKLLVLLGLMATALFLAACLIETATPTVTETSAEAVTATPAAGLPITPTPNQLQLGNRTFKQYAQAPLLTINPDAEYTATIRTNKGLITLELFASQAPITVNNFVFLAEDDFYNGVIFHRVISGFMIQGGDPTGTGSGGPGYAFQDEVVGDLMFDQAGILAMVNAGPNTNGSQFFITVGPTPHLTGAHTIFGSVVSGMAIVNEISRVNTDRVDRPLDPVVIQSVDVIQSGE